MSSQVQLYVYDLSNGLAGQLSMQMTGRQIDGIWSVGRYELLAFPVLTFEGILLSLSSGKRSSMAKVLALHLLANPMYVSEALSS